MAKAFGKLGSKFVTVTVGDEDDEHAEDDEDDEEHADEDKDDDDAHGSETITIKLGGSRKYVPLFLCRQACKKRGLRHILLIFGFLTSFRLLETYR